MVKNCDLGLENAALGLRPRAVFSRPQSQFFTIRTSQPANNIYLASCNHKRQFVLKLYFMTFFSSKISSFSFQFSYFKQKNCRSGTSHLL